MALVAKGLTSLDRVLSSTAVVFTISQHRGAQEESELLLRFNRAFVIVSYRGHRFSVLEINGLNNS